MAPRFDAKGAAVATPERQGKNVSSIGAETCRVFAEKNKFAFK